MGFGEGEAVPTGGLTIDVGGDVVRLEGAVERFAKRPEADFSPTEIGEQIIRMSRAIDMLRREQARLAGVFHDSDEAYQQGCLSEVDWLRHNANMSVGDALELFVVGKHLQKMQRSSAALDEGRVGFGHLVHMARNAEFSDRSKVAAFDEVPLLNKAERESVSRFRHTCLSARHAQDPAAVVEAEVNAVESRELTINPVDDGTTYLNIRLDDAEASVARSVLEGMAVRLGPDDSRTHSRRMADAFVEVIHFTLNEGSATEPVGKRVSISVTCTAETLLDLAGAPAAELEYGVISAATLNRLACNATITKILIDDRLIPVAVGHTKRVLSKAERRALNARDKGCRYPGCHRAASHCEGHHTTWYSKGGRTKLSETVLLCRFHHWRIHEGGWTLALTVDGQVIVVPPHLGNLARAPSLPVAA